MNDVFESQLFSITTIILTKYVSHGMQCCGNASGFYYDEVEPENHEAGKPHWVKFDKHWLITNKHVVHSDESYSTLVDEMTFCLREQTNNGIEWIPITITKDELKSILRIHKNPIVDVVALDVTEYIGDIIRKRKGKGLMLPTALTNENLPDNQPLTIDVTSDIVVASYPKGFYDKFNKFPIVKSGIIASAWGFSFNGAPMFQIDAQLFPGSSGGLVISKPTNIAMIDQQIKYSKIKQFVFLGIYSGEYLWQEKLTVDGKAVEVNRSYGLGNVWYSSLVPEIINAGNVVENKLKNMQLEGIGH